MPEAEAERNVQELWDWLDRLAKRGDEKTRFAGSSRAIVDRNGTERKAGDIFGMPVIEAGSLEEAVRLTADWPELAYGGRIEIVEALG